MSAPSVFEQLGNSAGIKQINSTELYPALHQPGDAGLPMLVVENALGRAVIALQGAHLMAFQPVGGGEMFWVSPKSALEAGKPIRGGIPLCLPWFGPSSDGKLLHGFPRLMPWSLVAAESLESGATRLVLRLSGDASVCALWPHAFDFRLEVVVGSELKLNFSARNCSTETAPFAFAFHTYFAVSDVAEARISGLDGVTYIDKMSDSAIKKQAGEVRLSAESVFIYLGVPPVQTLESTSGRVTIESATACAVVWNAWANARNIADIGEGNHVGYICVERGDVADHALSLQPGEKYQTWMTLS